MHYLHENQLHIFSHYIFLSFTINTLELERKKISHTSDIILSETFIVLIEHMLVQAKDQRRLLKTTMQKEQLVIQPLGSNDVFTSFLFILNHKEERRDFFNPAIRKKVEAMLIKLKHDTQTTYKHLYPKPTLPSNHMFISHIS
ncbi:hypothetical protein SAMN05421839_1563 [Halolactibacillus halophilus]|uniref:Uncharacterized protein n=1 Tax=Halolactibacillus halophilus TaxID=306540 RepID=A0A1I5SZC5_9BACI|nr:hypothetical protein [Halolactibacillus halophilus]GEM02818.1 hypothetical protein HHA03_23500 [Halolactibacillus halophilus]SFP75981.1 hypothetical protein SAMN05421839_1563 [Halolactibacillus halophilus]